MTERKVRKITQITKLYKTKYSVVLMRKRDPYLLISSVSPGRETKVNYQGSCRNQNMSFLSFYFQWRVFIDFDLKHFKSEICTLEKGYVPQKRYTRKITSVSRCNKKLQKEGEVTQLKVVILIVQSQQDSTVYVKMQLKLYQCTSRIDPDVYTL